MNPANESNTKYSEVTFAPSKSFFVSMLTRDIQLEDAILDLLDNCIDGILRNNKTGRKKKPYEGFYADINFDRNSFEISDNCGGIPWDLHEYAFRLGRSPSSRKNVEGSVGVYGIGMKRALFKIGEDIQIQTQNKNDNYEVEISPGWLKKENEWTIPVEERSTGMEQDGTTIVVGHLHDGIKATFGTGAEEFSRLLKRSIASHYAYIMDKGFTVRVNGDEIKPMPTKLVFDMSAKGIKPFIYKSKIDGVDIFLTVGFTREVLSGGESEDGEERYSSKNAGWTVVCNDRAVLYRDKTEMTGWGEAGVPSYHTQFIGIAGVVEFSAADPSKLPTTTTKRGIDASSSLYLKVKNKMREGMLIFIRYTNQWKGEHRAESKKNIDAAGDPVDIPTLKKQSSSLRFTTVKRASLAGKQYKPKLPEPKKIRPTSRRISFVKPLEEVQLVSEYLFDRDDVEPAKIGEKCFDLIKKGAD